MIKTLDFDSRNSGLTPGEAASAMDPRARADFVRDTIKMIPGADPDALCEIFNLTEEGLIAICEGRDWRPEFDIDYDPSPCTLAAATRNADDMRAEWKKKRDGRGLESDPPGVPKRPIGRQLI